MTEAWRGDYLRMVATIEKSENLTDWEKSFLSSFKTVINSTRIPTAKQIETIGNLFDRKAGR